MYSENMLQWGTDFCICLFVLALSGLWFVVCISVVCVQLRLSLTKGAAVYVHDPATA